MEELIYNVSLETQMAVVWLIPCIIIGLIIAGGGIALLIKPKDIHSMAVLGMAGAGKTTWYDYLTGSQRSGAHTPNFEEIGTFTIKIENGSKTHTIKIRKGKDISGMKEKVSVYYDDMIKESDLILFMFDADKFYNNQDYKKDANARIQKIQITLRNIQTENTDIKKDFVIIATHKDLIDKHQVENIQTDIESNFKAKHVHIHFSNMKDQKQLDFLKQQLFGEKA